MDIVPLVLHSKKALQHAEGLCTRANMLAQASINQAVDVQALDAKIKWITEGIGEQLKLATSISKSIHQQQEKLIEDAKGWDSARAERMRSLDRVLESLGDQVVPPNLHQMGTGSSLFGSHHSSLNEKQPGEGTISPNAPLPDAPTDRASWKTLRDFVDERAIEEAMERMEQDRSMLDDLLASTISHPDTLTKHVATIRTALPEDINAVVEQLIVTQESISTGMANHLVSLAKHYEQMATALREKDDGHELAEDDMQVFRKDTDELPSIIAELEESITAIESINDQLSATKFTSQEALRSHHTALASLEELAEVMEMMLDEQHQVEAEAATLHITLRSHLSVMSELEETYVKYQQAYHKLIIEMDRRQKYRESIQSVIGGMTAQLDAMRNEEISHREAFFKTQGNFLPEDLCPFVTDLPSKAELTLGDENEIAIDSAFLSEIKTRSEPRSETGER